MKLFKHSLLVVALGSLVVACGAPADDSVQSAPLAKIPAAYAPSAAAGIPLTKVGDPKLLTALYEKTRKYGSRSNPFLLQGEEIRFNIEQTGERLAAEGGFGLEYQPPAPKEDEVPVLEPQPYRRLMGIVIGDAVVAILETMGEAPIIIRPGQQIPGTEWTVASIDEERAVLRRPGNKKPNEVVVRLENPPPGMGGAASGPAGGPPPGGPPAGGPGAGRGRPGGNSLGR